MSSELSCEIDGDQTAVFVAVTQCLPNTGRSNRPPAVRVKGNERRKSGSFEQGGAGISARNPIAPVRSAETEND